MRFPPGESSQAEIFTGAGLPGIAAQVNVTAYWGLGVWLVRRRLTTKPVFLYHADSSHLPELRHGAKIPELPKLVVGVRRGSSMRSAGCTIQNTQVRSFQS